MSTIKTFYNLYFNVIRKIAGSGSNARILIDSVISTSNSGVIRPITDLSQLFDTNNYGKEYDLYCSNLIDIKAGDVVVVGSSRYNVQGLSVFEDLEDNTESHQRVRINKQNSNSDA